VVVDLTSGDSGGSAHDRKMHANVLQSSKYPEAVFVPKSTEGTQEVPGSSNVRVHGTFTMHGAAHEITMDVQTTATADQIKAVMAFDIPHVASGMKDRSNFLLEVDKTVKVSIEAAGPLQKH
jgi:polyisoprenoid-binding protein YceI